MLRSVGYILVGFILASAIAISSAQVQVDVLTFEGGLISDLTAARYTTSTHGRGCRRAENFIVWPQGPAMTRPPSRYIARTRNDDAARLIPIPLTEDAGYLAVLTPGRFRFYTADGVVLKTGLPYEVTTAPYTADQLPDVTWCNDGDTVYFWHPDWPPFQLVHTAETSWSFTEVPFEWGPFRDDNANNRITGDPNTGIKIDPNGTTGTITLSASSPIFEAGHLGSVWRIGHERPAQTLSYKFSGNGTSSTVQVKNDRWWGRSLRRALSAALIRLAPPGYGVTQGAEYTYDLTANGEMTITLERSYDGGSTWYTVDQIAVTTLTDEYSPAADTLRSRLERGGSAHYRWKCTNYSSGWCQCNFHLDPQIAYGYVTITQRVTSSLVWATVNADLYSDEATEIWAEGAWSHVRRYPRAGGIFDGRLVCVSNADQPTAIWMSHTNEHTDMLAGVQPADALVYDFALATHQPFRWFLGGLSSFTVGTPAAILEMRCADPTGAISPTNKPQISRRVDLGSAAVQPLRLGGSLIYLGADRRRVMHSVYEWQHDRLVSPDLAFSCPGLTEPGIARMVFTRTPFPILWCLRTDGVLLGLTYEDRYGETVLAWHQHSTAGVLEDIAVLPGSSGDTLWWLAARTIDGTTQRHIERLDSLDVGPERATAHALDAYCQWSGAPAVEIADINVAAVTHHVTVCCDANHGFDVNDLVRFSDVGGMTWLNEQSTLRVADVNEPNFALQLLDGSYVDGSLLSPWTAGGTVEEVNNTLTGLDHLEGQSVYAVCQGAVSGPYTVDANTISLEAYHNTLVVGLQADAYLQPLRVLIPLQSGSSRARTLYLAGVWISVYRSGDFQMGPDAADLVDITVFDSDSAAAIPVGQPAPLATRDFYRALHGGYTDDPTILIKRHRPLPLTVRALMLDTAIHGKQYD